MATQTRSQAWFPGRFISLRQITGAEILSDRHRVSVQVSKTTIHGSSSQLLAVGMRMVRAAIAANPELAVRLAAEAPELRLVA
jgi:hypothetical protein